MQTTIIKFKVSSLTLIVLYIYNSKPDIIYHAIKQKINESPQFLKNASVILNISYITSNIDWKKIKCAILSTGLKLIGVIGCNHNNLKNEISNSDIPILPYNLKIKKKNNFYQNDLIKSKIIETQIRSGQKIYSHNDLIIINNVNSGAELIAKGNIHVYGYMRGKALAGAMGDHNCQIFCTNLYAELISITGKYWVMEQIPSYLTGKSVRFYLKNDILKANKIN